MSLTFDDIKAAHERIRTRVKRTPVLTSAQLDAQTGGQLFFKCENLQEVGAFKARGAANAVFQLTDAQAANGVVTHSSGNHAAALARAARLRGIAAYIVMPSNSALTKVRNVESFGGKITFCEPNQAAREQACAKIAAETGATLVHPFENFLVMAGQGTAVLEFLADQPDLELMLVPVGGGGLLSGTAVAAKGVKPGIKVIGTEPAQADDASQSFHSGKRVATVANTIADGLRTSIGEPNFAVMQASVDDVVTVTEQSIVTAMRQLWEALRVIVEPSAAVPFAAILEGRVNVKDQRVGIILSGGNVDLDALPWMKK